ncbi:MAG TPA: sensor domain-containing diguanylate cyclase [Longimicrobium sp.]|nr:sensor domain-containing diguanylate cyclase [Longimicrobium sp.]
MRFRRGDDRSVGVVLATPTAWIGDGGGAAMPGGRLRGASLPDEGELLVLLQGDDDDGLLVAASGTCRVPGGTAGAGVMERAAARLAALRRERQRMQKRQRLPDQLIAYFEELNAAECEDEVFRAIAAHALAVVGAHTTLALVRDRARGMLRAPASPGARPGEWRPSLLWDARFGEPGLLLALDARAGGVAPCAAPLFGDPQTALIAHVPIGGGSECGVLVLTERREERIFEPEDWEVLRVLALQAEMALRRIRLIASVRNLSLTDSLTGLANRRHMDVVLEHAWAAARRGEPLAVMVLDLDGFKAINDDQGHLAGDRLLCAVAEALRCEARGADVVVRYGGDEFLVILPGGSTGGGRALAERVRARLSGRVGVSEGIAEYHPECASPDDLIREADRALYEAKRAKASPES